MQVVDDQGVPVEESQYRYTWNGSPVSSATYRNNLATLFDQTQAEALWETQGLSYQGILV